ncbi:MAG: hypothetical protein ACI4I2_12510 [Oscillospiraceae bacterium]
MFSINIVKADDYAYNGFSASFCFSKTSSRHGIICDRERFHSLS